MFAEELAVGAFPVLVVVFGLLMFGGTAGRLAMGFRFAALLFVAG
jgi:hypothetical protein